MEQQTRMVGHSALHREATVGANREGHRGLAGRRIIGGMQSMAQGENDYRFPGPVDGGIGPRQEALNLVTG